MGNLLGVRLHRALKATGRTCTRSVHPDASHAPATTTRLLPDLHVIDHRGEGSAPHLHLACQSLGSQAPSTMPAAIAARLRSGLHADVRRMAEPAF